MVKLVGLLTLLGCSAAALGQENPRGPFPQPQMPPPGYGQPPADSFGVPQLHLTVVADSPKVELIAENTGNGAVYTVCHVPCSTNVAADAQFRIGGDGVNPSDSFWLPKERSVAVRVRAGSRGLNVTGKVLTWLGAGLLSAGVLTAGSAVLSPGNQKGATLFPDEESAHSKYLSAREGSCGARYGFAKAISPTRRTPVHGSTCRSICPDLWRSARSVREAGREVWQRSGRVDDA
ncbi:MAG: hypothetical protein ACYDCL_16780 [Myxococcales bacterium]